jgi:hypothetical protein
MQQSTSKNSSQKRVKQQIRMVLLGKAGSGNLHFETHQMISYYLFREKFDWQWNVETESIFGQSE